MKATELCNIAGTLTREIQTKFNFKFKHTLGPQNTGQIKVKVLLTAFNRINVAFVKELLTCGIGCPWTVQILVLFIVLEILLMP